MFIFRTMSPDEVARMQKPKLTIDLSEYEDAIRNLQIGEGGVIEPDGVDVKIEKRRLTLAAHKLGFDIQYRRMPDGVWAWRRTNQVTARAS